MSNILPEFIRQNDEPLYPDILFNRPVTRSGRGKLLIVGGHSGEFSLPTTIYQLAMASGAGECLAALPESLAKLLDGAPGVTYVASGPTGALYTEALSRLLELSEGSDAIAIGASLSNSSHTTILLERLLDEVRQPLIAFDDALILLQHRIRLLTDRPKTLLILTMPEVFKLAGKLGVPIHIREGGGLVNKLEIIHDLANASKCDYAVYGSEIITVATKEDGEREIVVTPINYRLGQLEAVFYGTLSVFWMQNSLQRAEGLAVGAYILSQISHKIAEKHGVSSVDAAKLIIEELNKHEF